MKIGSRFHELLDPGSGIDKRYRCSADIDRRTKAFKELELAASADGVELIAFDEWQTIHAMAESVRANPYARSLLEDAEREVGFRMPSPYGYFKIQARADALHRWTNIIDIKTTVDVDDFATSVRTYLYYRQAALY
jgi:hypothetical protein